jgi:hypothetical protein
MKANYQMLGLAFFTFYQDTINVSLPKKFELKVALTPTYYYPAFSIGHWDIVLISQMQNSTV